MESFVDIGTVFNSGLVDVVDPLATEPAPERLLIPVCVDLERQPMTTKIWIRHRAE